MRLVKTVFLVLPLTVLMMVNGLGSVSPSFAAPTINDEGALKAKAIAEEFLKNYKTMFSSSSSNEFIEKGEITVEQGEEFYAVTMPDITIKNTKTKQDKKIITNTKIGMIAMNMAPTDTPTEWNISAALPDPILVTDEAGKTIVSLNIKNQSFAAVWNTELMAASKIAATFSNINFIKQNSLIIASIEKITANTTTTKNADNTWSGPADISLHNFRIGDLNDLKLGGLQLDTLELKSNIVGYSPQILKQLNDITLEIESKHSEREKIKPPAEFFDLFRQLANGYNTEIKLSGLTIQNRAKENATPTKDPMKIETAYLKFNINDLKLPVISNQIVIGYDGMVMPLSVNSNAENLPKTLGLNIKIEKFPLDKIVAFSKNIAAQQPQQGDLKQQIQTAGIMALMALPAVFSEAKTTLRLEDAKLSSNSYSLGAKGYITATTESFVGALAEANIKFIGLNNLIALLKKSQTTQEPTKAAKTEKFITQLSLLEKLGEPDAKNPKIKSVNFKLNKEGQSLINGKDLKTVIAENTPPQTAPVTPNPAPAVTPAQ